VLLTTPNQRWLAGYRHPRCFDEHIAARLLEVFNRPRALMDGAELVGDPLGVLPVLYHLLWKQQLVADLAVVLSHRTMVKTVLHRADLAQVAQVAADLAEVAELATQAIPQNAGFTGFEFPTRSRRPAASSAPLGR
jgi:hypothetical protein